MELRENEVLVVFGAMAAHVSGGVFAPGAYRIVGDPFAGRGRCEAVLELRPQPTASLTFATALQDAGHTVSRRCGRSTCVKGQVKGLCCRSGSGSRAGYG